MKKKIFAIIGSAASNSANRKLVETIAGLTANDFNVIIYNDLKALPHFDAELSIENPPEVIAAFRNAIQKADGIIICTPEYVFSIPSGLKNAVEWCVSTTIFSDKPCGLITASANGEKGHQELQLIMKTLMAKFTEETTVLIQGIKGKLDKEGNVIDIVTQKKIKDFINAFRNLVNNN